LSGWYYKTFLFPVIHMATDITKLAEFFQPPTSLRILAVSDVDFQSTHSLAEKFVPHMPELDCILCMGPFEVSVKQPVMNVSTAAGASSSSSTAGNGAKNVSTGVALSEISTVLAFLENIVCRVVYLPSEDDPPSALMEQLHLTPNSVNIYARRLSLIQGLFLTGYTEVSDKMSEQTDEYSEISGNGVRTFGDAEQDIHDILEAGNERAQDAANTCDSPELNKLNRKRGIFMLDYAHAHTLNQFLFHQTDVLVNSGVFVAVVPRKCGIESFPTKIGDMHIVSVPSMRKERRYVIFDVKLVDGAWHFESCVTHEL
jgi:hypothetical protein